MEDEDAAAADKHAKPFMPQEANNIVMSLNRPAVFSDMVSDWPVLDWNASYLSEKLKGKKIRFRMGKKTTDAGVQFETQCSYVNATLEQFLVWSSGKYAFPSPFTLYDSSKYWAYADYKYMANLLDKNTEMFQDVVWSDFGFPERNGQDSTLWIGTMGANTPCHMDSYGCNLVVQVQGRKRWHLFHPEDTDFLYPTRIPYEESSVFSKVNVVNPDWNLLPQFRKARAYVVTLHPGEVLFVPRHWWHYVESIDPVTVSVNSWIEQEEDHVARVEEAITRMLVCGIKSTQDPGNTEVWLNPTEAQATSHETNLQFLNQAVAACVEKQRRDGTKGKSHSSSKECMPTQAYKRQKRNRGDCRDEAYTLQCEPDGSTIPLEYTPTKTPGLKLVPVSDSSQLFGDGNKLEVHFLGTDEDPLKTLQNTGMRLRTPSDHTLAANSSILEGSVNLSPKTISTNEVLDCVVHPQLVSLMARLLLERSN